MLKYIICGIILGILLKMLSNRLNNLNNNIKYAIKEKETQRRNEEFRQRQEELKQQEIEEQEEFRQISYSTLYKGANTLKGNRYKFFAKISQVEGENICYAYMQKYFAGYRNLSTVIIPILLISVF